MSTSRAIKPKRDDTQLKEWESIPERAPSLEVDDRPLFARVVAMIGLFLFVLGGLAMLAPTIWQTRTAAISPAWGFFLGSIGVVMLLFHSFLERDFQFRRIYAFLGIALVLLGVILRLVAFKTGILVTKPGPFTGPELFFYFGVPGMFLGLVFLIAVIRNESELSFRNLLVNITGGVGAVMLGACVVVAGVVTAVRANDFLAGEGALLFIIGMAFACTYISQEFDADRAYYAGLGVGAIGLVGLAVGLIRSFWPESAFLVPGGLVLIGISLVALIISLAICVDWPILLLARRELAAYFFSPVAYLVILGLVVTGGLMFLFFIEKIVGQRGMMEPIVGEYIFEIVAVIVQIFIIPVLTMRLLSEEQRSGTLEVLLTAPVNEVSIVLGKFFACWSFYMICWLPWWVNLVALRFMGGEEFDYRPVLSFMVAQGAVGAGLLAMGLFFSSLTSNQIVAAVLSFVGVMAHLAFYIMKFQRRLIQEGGAVFEALTFINFYDLWQSALGGTIAPRYLIFHVSVAAFFLFATIKVLESRKWK